MTKTDVMNNITRTFSKVGFQLKKHSPEILVVTGIVGGVVSAVMACKATTKVGSVLDNAKETIDEIHNRVEAPEAPEKDLAEANKRALTLTYARTGLELAKLYGPSIGLATLSTVSILSGTNILHKRNAAIAAAYTAVDKGFKEYRDRVVDRFGQDMDRELRYNLKAKEVEEVVVDEDGKETTVKKTVSTCDPGHPNYGPYSIVFDDGNRGWDKDPAITKWNLVQQQNWANEKLRSRGWLTLNDVYEMLGAHVTEMGSTIGWVHDPKNPELHNYVDFGIFDIHNAKACDFVNGREKVIILDFNVDGNVWDLMR